MGKGDKKSKRGKIIMGSYGVRRPANKKKNDAIVEAKETPKKKIAPKAEKVEKEADKPKKEVVETEEIVAAKETAMPPKEESVGQAKDVKTEEKPKKATAKKTAKKEDKPEEKSLFD